MKISMLLRFLSLAFVATALSLTASAQTAAGQIKIAKVEGEVSKLSASGATAPVKAGDLLVESDTVITGKSSSAILAFQNGSTVKLGAESRLAIDEFKIDPFAESVKLSELKGEPSASKTALNLAYGEMVGDVKKLNKSSSYSIKTPVGAAGIRGTVYRIVFRPSADGKAFFSVQTESGRVVVEGVTAGEVPVEAGKEVVVEVNTDNPTAPVVVTQDLPPATIAAIKEAAQVITEAVSSVVITPTPTPTPAPTPTPPPPTETPTPPTPTTTPGAGT